MVSEYICYDEKQKKKGSVPPEEEEAVQARRKGEYVSLYFSDQKEPRHLKISHSPFRTHGKLGSKLECLRRRMKP